ncbi:SMI1/KNR4 family protein [Aestuariirhabdus litorea]|uniref:SMI1/KNR4 family protein n=1 Tax=Aestuariirhabdus litorea TaxID=2528527 RepID=A0A3P3VN52_9GAMM|nr:SMI1/KNR4 family protein [Aestuariirhabdus litorea]RRJ83066.1 SMI1/KNR4 family protein [Aestuariirhabdus litorea]RWW93224.1 SMI1/KNR4 family protein [Endozoicomonadaceae bacterium GTF-13]
MEEVIDELRELAESVPVPLELPTEDELVEVEEQILIPLPYELRRFLLTASDIVYGTLEPVTASDPQLHTYLPEVASVAWSLGLPREYVPLCEDRGRYYAVDAQGEVLLWTEEGIDEERWESVWHWVRDIWMES